MKETRQQKLEGKNLGSAPKRISDTQSRKRNWSRYMKSREVNHSTSTTYNLEASGVAGSPKKREIAS